MTFYFILCFFMYINISFFAQGTVLYLQLCEKAGHFCYTMQINKYMSTSKKYIMFKILNTYSINNFKSLRNKQESKDDRC